MENGNKIIGSKRGEIISNDGIIINADSFVYNKNTLIANGNVEVIDKINDYKILSEEINYDKDETIYQKEPLLVKFTQDTVSFQKI